jgi:hypothetical protein
MTTPTTDIAAWTAAVCDKAERVASTMDCQTDLFGMSINEMCGMRVAVDRLSVRTTSLLRVAASTVADEEEDEEADEEAVGKEVGEDAEEEQEGDVAVDVAMGEVSDESGGDEEENKGGAMTRRKERRKGRGLAEWSRTWCPRCPRACRSRNGHMSRILNGGRGRTRGKAKCDGKCKILLDIKIMKLNKLSKVKRKEQPRKTCLSRPGFVGMLAVKFVY